MIKTIVFYVIDGYVSDDQKIVNGKLCKQEFVRHEEAIAFANKVESKESYLVSINQSGGLYCVNNCAE